MKKILLFFCVFCGLFARAQRDSIFLKINLEERVMKVEQKIVYSNRSQNTLDRIKLLNFVAAYKNRITPLLKRKLEDRKPDLYYATEEQQGKLLDLSINGHPSAQNLEEENVYVDIPPLLPGKSTTLKMEYRMQLPDVQYTGYGVGKDFVLLKYFFLVPDSFDAENKLSKNYLDIEETSNIGTYYRLDLSALHQESGSNLAKSTDKIREGILNTDVELYLSEKKGFILHPVLDGKKYTVELGYAVTEEEQKNLEFYLPKHLSFIQEKTGKLPQTIFISEKEKIKNDFLGNEDLKFWKWKFQLFTDAEKTDLDYFSLISQEVAEQFFMLDKNTDHWIPNGLKSYLEMQYLERFYQETLLLGKLPEYKILGFKPLKITYFSRLKLIERYGMPYQYIMAKNLDQKIDEKLQDLSNFNEFAVSKFETGSLFNFIAEKIGKEKFEEFLKNYIARNGNTAFYKKGFLDQLAISSGYSSAFLEEYVQHKNRINFKLKSFQREGDDFLINISKNTSESLPFKLETLNQAQEKTTYWYDSNTQKGSTVFRVPGIGVQKIVVNDHYAFPESNFRDNYLYTESLLNNAKKIKFKFFTDNPNPEYNEVYMTPKLAWNNYDKVLLGMKFQNRSLFERPFQYAVSPYFSTGTKSFAGSFAFSYRIRPPESFYRSLNLNFGASHFHYDFDLSYRKMALSAVMELHKNPRSQIERNIVASYNYLDRQLSQKMILAKDYAKYNLWNLGFIYSENGSIKDRYLFGNMQLMEDFQKISAEGFYRWVYARDKKISFRFFGGAFINNQTKNGNFDLGISRVSNYAFSYNLLAQSASTGILSQQFVIAEGGFKSLIGGFANQFVLAHNIDAHAWKMFNIYADVGLYKNKHHAAKFIWDSGIKLKVIPDFLEIYFPLQSSLGFEPGFRDYKSRIRYTLNFNLSAVIGYFRRGWY